MAKRVKFEKPNKNIVKRFNNRFRKLIQKDIRKKGSIRTGTMLKSIDPVFNIDKKGELVVNLDAVYYYEYVDGGTRYITPRDFTKDVVNSEEFAKILEELMIEISLLTVKTMFRNTGFKI